MFDDPSIILQPEVQPRWRDDYGVVILPGVFIAPPFRLRRVVIKDDVRRVRWIELRPAETVPLNGGGPSANPANHISALNRRARETSRDHNRRINAAKLHMIDVRPHIERHQESGPMRAYTFMQENLRATHEWFVRRQSGSIVRPTFGC